MEVSASLIKELKEKTGAGIVDCKQTLQETSGDMDKAVEILRKKGMGKADKKSGRAAKEGTVSYKLEGKKGLVVKINCETDFVAKTDNFKKFVMDVTELVFKKGTAYTAELPEDIENLRREVIAKVGENVLVSDWKFIEAKGELFPYTHCDRFAVKVAVIADYKIDKQDDESKQLMKNLTMQITAMNPAAVDADSLPKAMVDELKVKFMEEAKETGKPEKILENIVKGKLEKFYNESLLMEQLYILDEEK
jgi:elongation factor Ts